MPMSESARLAEAVHRKLRAIAAVLSDPAATVHERNNAEALKKRTPNPPEVDTRSPM